MNVVKILNKGRQVMPEYADDGAAGMDLRANIDEPLELHPMQRVLIKTGLHMQMPDGMVGFVCPRSGLAMKHGITVLNAPGVIDSSYRGDVGVILVNLSEQMFTVYPGERIAQIVFAWHATVELDNVTELSETERGEGGFGHTGVE